MEQLPTVEQVRAFSAANERLARNGARQVVTLAHSVDLYNAALAERTALEAMTRVLTTHAAMSHQVAARFAREAWAESGLPGQVPMGSRYRVDDDELKTAVAWASSPLYGRPDVAAFDSRLEAVFGSRLNQASADAIKLSGNNSESTKRRQRTRYAVVPSGNCCSFCSLQASRGAVFRSPDIGKFHDHCRCSLVPVYSYVGSDGIEIAKNSIIGYDPEPYFELYEKAREQSDGTTKDILRQMRVIGGLK